MQHSTLRYHWVRYIPTDHVADDFWGDIRTRIWQGILRRRLFYSRSNSQSVSLSSLSVLPSKYNDSRGEPLLPDLPDLSQSGRELYVSKRYDPSTPDLSILQALGLRDHTTNGFLARLEADLDNGTNSRMRYRMLHDMSWHTEVAERLHEALDHNYSDRIRILSIIPLTSGMWARGRGASIFFPTSGGVEIPEDLLLSMVDAAAVSNPSRRRLFSRLGVTECIPERVFPLIEQRYLYQRAGNTFQSSLSHCKFMFWHHQKLPSAGLNIRLAPNFDGQLWFQPLLTRYGWTYCPCAEDITSPAYLFGTNLPAALEGRMSIISRGYYDMLEQCGRRNDQHGVVWFKEFFQIQDNLRVESRSTPGIASSEFDYVIDHRPDIVLRSLKGDSHWTLSDYWKARLRHVKVPVMASDHLRDLSNTFLPLTRLVEIVSQLGLSHDFGFLKELHGQTDLELMESARWLEQLGVGVTEDVSFWIALLRHAKSKQDVEPHVAFEIYQNLQRYTQLHEMTAIR